LGKKGYQRHRSLAGPVVFLIFCAALELHSGEMVLANRAGFALRSGARLVKFNCLLSETCRG